MVTNSYDRLIQALGADLTPVRRLAPPGVRTLIWLTIVGAIALALATVSDVGAMSRRLMSAPDMWLAAIGSLVTAVLAAVAAFQLSLPDRKPAWALVPCARNPPCIARGGRDLPSLHSRHFSSTFGPPDRHVATGLSAATEPHIGDRRARLCLRRGHPAQFHPPL